MAKGQMETISIPMVVEVPYKFAAGKYMSRFLTELKENGRIFAVKCPRCRRG